MTEVRLGGTDLWVSRLGLGTVELGLPYGIGNTAPPEERDGIALLQWAYDQGITYFDTAAGYGRSEELLGRAFAGLSSRPTIATKVALSRPGEDKLLRGKELVSHIKKSLLNSLRALTLERLDLLKVHAPAHGLFLSGELLELMQELSSSGQVRYWGVSTYGVDQPLHALEHAGTIRAVQVAYNLLDRGPATTIFPACARAGMGLILRSVFLKGALSNRLNALPQTLAPLRRAGEAARQIAQELGVSLPALALRFCASQPLAQVVLVGTADRSELAGNLAAFAAGPLPEDVLGRINTIEIEDQALLNPGNWGIG
ncbi:MAG: aldo/keto reductase [Candidatus Handelsmanbacteria bacterium]|nr:aldo/keto reductase [Candidatus Handelsmanbacteria bacterium]